MIHHINKAWASSIAGFVGAACTASTKLKAPRAYSWAPDTWRTPMVYLLNFVINALLRLSAFLRWTRTG
ncbi:hypothetical protein [Bosea sp. AS-1]|uniref:hypothetical protein n=1 Tax=Bosea sp. AS-1 TaxID=2015316 RepID=UPI0012FDE36D|nr:hypothetical protein [Bosea sp. AS-1]